MPRADRVAERISLSRLSAASLFGGLVLLAGCAPENELGREAVSGTVNLDGQPLDGGTISFEPLGEGGTSGGSTVTAGTFQIPEEQGLPPGTYRVRISAPEGGAAATEAEPPPPGESAQIAKERIPAKWNTQSQEQVEVKADGENAFTFDVKTSG